MGKIGKLLVLFLIMSVPAFAAGNPVIKYEGSSTAGLFMKDASEVYKGASIEISVLTESNGGEICPLAKTCDIGGVARDIHPLFVSRGLYAIPFAYDVLTAIVNSKNPVKELTSDQLKGIFSGKIKNWREVGGENRPITVYIVGKESATRDVFKKHILQDSEYGVYSRVTRPDWRIVLSVNMDQGGIGHTSYSFAANTENFLNEKYQRAFAKHDGRVFKIAKWCANRLRSNFIKKHLAGSQVEGNILCQIEFWHRD